MRVDWLLIWAYASVLFGMVLGSGCAPVQPHCSTTAIALQQSCSTYAQGLGIPIRIDVVPDGTPFGGPGNPRPTSGPPNTYAYSLVPGGRRPTCYIVLQEAHMRLPKGYRDRLLRHEVTHCMLWLRDGDPDRDHALDVWTEL